MIRPAVTFALLAMAACATSQGYETKRWPTGQEPQGPTVIEDSINFVNKAQTILNIITLRRPTLRTLNNGLKELNIQRPLPKPKDCKWYEKKLCPSNCNDLVSTVTTACTGCSGRMEDICVNVQDKYSTLVLSQFQDLISEVTKLQASVNRAKSKPDEEMENPNKCEAPTQLNPTENPATKSELESAKVMLDSLKSELRTKREERKRLVEEYAKEKSNSILRFDNCSQSLKDASEKLTPRVLQSEIIRAKLRGCEEQKVNLTVYLKMMFTTLEDQNRKFQFCRDGTEVKPRIKMDQAMLLASIEKLEKTIREVTSGNNGGINEWLHKHGVKVSWHFAKKVGIETD